MNLLKKLIIKYKIYSLRKRLKNLDRKRNILDNGLDILSTNSNRLNEMTYKQIMHIQAFHMAVKINRIKTETRLSKLEQELKNG